jgi:hypothetical protein
MEVGISGGALNPLFLSGAAFLSYLMVNPYNRVTPEP